MPRKRKRSSGVAKRVTRARAHASPAPAAVAEPPRETLLAGPGLTDVDDLDETLAAMNRAATDHPRRTALVRRRA